MLNVVKQAQSYFKENDSTLGNLVGEVCAAHWYDISQIGQVTKNKLALDHLVNIQALCIYIRFIDLLDIGKNRTPYSLWKFINPRNSFSANEWHKHGVLEPVYFERNSASDKVLNLRIQGRTNDHRVYASLKDMESWVSSQIKENEILLQDLGVCRS